MAGQTRPSPQPTSPAVRTTTGNGTAKRVRARNAATAKAMRLGWVRARRLSRNTAWMTMAMTAGARPRNRPVINGESPKAT